MRKAHRAGDRQRCLSGGPLATPANDAGLIAQTLQAAGFDVVGARDLDQDLLRHAFRDFLDKATNSGPDTVAFVYVGGYGLQLEGENYFVPIDAKIARDSDIRRNRCGFRTTVARWRPSSLRPALSLSTARAPSTTTMPALSLRAASGRL